MTTTSTPVATPGLAADGAALIAHFRDPLDQARVALAWAHDLFGNDLVVASSMGDTVLVHLASEVIPEVNVLFIDTGYHFPETLGTAAAHAATRPIRLLTVTPRQSVAEQNATDGTGVVLTMGTRPEDLERGLASYSAWITGMRRDDAPSRADIEVITWDRNRGMVKVNPLAAWSDADVEAYSREHDVLENPLREVGYASIGCAPCTRPTSPGEGPRAGRWAGLDKTECGLHT